MQAVRLFVLAFLAPALGSRLSVEDSATLEARNVISDVEEEQGETSIRARAERAVGAMMGVLVGDALGMGMQWYYSLEDKERDYGAFVTDFVDPRPDRGDRFGYISKYRYEQGLRAGDSTQAGQVFSMLMDAAANSGTGYQSAFLAQLDGLFTTLSGESLSGRYTDQIYIKTRQARLDGQEWGNGTATDETTSDGAVLSVVLAALYIDPTELTVAAMELMKPLLSQGFIVQNSAIFALAVQSLINGVAVDELGAHMKTLAHNPEIRDALGAYDNFQTPGVGAVALPGTSLGVAGQLTIEPPKLVSLLFGLDCQFTHVSPAAYYLMHAFPTGFENAVLSASNGGGQNAMRAALTGALSGAAVGIGGIPARFVDGLTGGPDSLRLARRIAMLSETGDH